MSELSASMLAALQSAAGSPLAYSVAGWKGDHVRGFPTSTMEALRRRGLLRLDRAHLRPKHRAYAITDAGRDALVQL